MEKLLWNTLGAILFIANATALTLCALTCSTTWCIVLFIVVIADAIYIRHRPTWLEV
jgi:hypothetical protein